MRSARIVCLFSLFVASVASDCGGDASCLAEKEKDGVASQDGAALLQNIIQLHGGTAEQEEVKENEEEEEEAEAGDLVEEELQEKAPDTPGWNNNYGHGCSSYQSRGWCVGGAFAAGLEWTGKTGFKKSGKCGNGDCGAFYNHPGQNCAVCKAAPHLCPSPSGKHSGCSHLGGGSGYTVSTCTNKMYELSGDTFNYKNGACYVKKCGSSNMKYSDKHGGYTVWSTYCEASTCSNNPTPYMLREGFTCANTPNPAEKCNSNKWWRSKKFCQRSCFETGHGYDGDFCRVLFQPKYPIGAKCTHALNVKTLKIGDHRRRWGPNSYYPEGRSNADGTDDYRTGYAGGCACRRRAGYASLPGGWMCDNAGKYHRNLVVYVPQCKFPSVVNSASKSCEVWSAYSGGAVPAGQNCRTRCRDGYAPNHQLLMCTFGNLWPPTFTCTACADFSPSKCTANECEISGWGVCQKAFCSEFTQKGQCTAQSAKCKWHDATRTCQVKQLTCADQPSTTAGCPVKYNCELRDGKCQEVVADVTAPTSCDAGDYLVDYLLDADNCIEDCPPGFFKTAHVNGKGGTCKECDGKIVNNVCRDCPPGKLSVTGANHCQNIQASCKPDQCGPCLTCLGNVAEDLQSCVKQHGCFHPGTTWCSSSIEAMADCQSESLGCWYKVMCEAACVCDSWKKVKCGGKTANRPCFDHLSQLQTNTSTNVQLLEDKFEQRRQQGSEEMDAVSLDEAVSGKRAADC